MSDGIMGLLSVKNWKVAHNDAVSYPADFTTVETPPTANSGNDYWRFARIQAIDGDLVYKVVAPGETAPTYGTGHSRVFQGSYDVVQLPYNATIKIGGVGGAVNGAVIWGQ